MGGRWSVALVVCAMAAACSASERTDAGPPTTDASPGARVPGELAATLRGDFLYFADAAIFTECGSGRALPVAMEGAYIDAERAYTAATQGSMQPLRIEVVASVQERPRVDAEGTEPTLVVERYVGEAAGADCPGVEAQRAFADTEWRLTHLGGEAVEALDAPTPNATFVDEGRQLSGDTGCNRTMGPYRRRGTGLDIGPLATTRRACVDERANARERAFLDALQGTEWFWITDDALTLYAGEAALARFTR